MNRFGDCRAAWVRRIARAWQSTWIRFVKSNAASRFQKSRTATPTRTFPKLGISEIFHPASHHQNVPGRLEALTRINAHHVQLFSHVLERLKATPDGDGNLLDHTLLLYGSAMSNSNVHNHGPLPVLVAGGAAGRLKGGRHIKYPENTPMSNLLMSIMDKAGIPQASVGDSTGMLSEV